MESSFTVTADKQSIETAHLAWRMNTYDTVAVEQALLLKEELGDSCVTVLSIGPERVKQVIQKALEMGCDEGIHILTTEEVTPLPSTIASLIAAYAKEKQFDLILTGVQSEDLANAQVGVLTGEMLNIPVVTSVVKFSATHNKFILHKELEQGSRAKVSVLSPALVTCQTGLNIPRYPTFPNIMKAKKKTIETIVDSTCSISVLPQEMLQFIPPKKSDCTVLEGTVEDLARTVSDMLRKAIGRG